MELPNLDKTRKRTKNEVQEINYHLNDLYKNIGKNKTFYVKTYGCQMNEHDSENIEGLLESIGFTKNSSMNAADIIILNTCSIRENAHNKAFGMLGRLKHLKEEYPEKIVALCGCMAQEEVVISEILKKHRHVNFIFGTHNVDITGFDYFIKNPGVPIDHELVLKAKELNIPVINEVEMAYHLLPDDITLIGITGTNGKTTTTTLTYEILKEAFKDRVHLVGNIGYPLTSIISKVKPKDIIVMEVSVQQSENIIDFHPNIGLITNFSEAHIDFFKTYDNYKRVKSKMFYNQSKDDVTILNLDNKEVIDELHDIKSIKKYFSTKDKTNCYLKDNTIYYNDEKVIDTDIGCTFYYTEEYDEPFCDLDNEIEVIQCQDKD